MRSKDKKYNLTKSQEMFCEYLNQGYSQRKAYILAFPDSKDSKPSVIDMKAWKLFHTEAIQARYNELCEITTEENIRKAIWTKEQALSELKRVLENNKKESYRYEEAYLDEMELLNKQINERLEILANVEKNNKNPAKYISKKKQAEIRAEIDELKLAKIKCNRRWQSNKSVNDAILQAVLQMNTMMGFDKLKEEKTPIEAQVQISFVDDVPEED